MVQNSFPCEFRKYDLNDIVTLPLGFFFANQSLANWFSRLNLNSEKLDRTYNHIVSKYSRELNCESAPSKRLSVDQVSGILYLTLLGYGIALLWLSLEKVRKQWNFGESTYSIRHVDSTNVIESQLKNLLETNGFEVLNCTGADQIHLRLKKTQ